MHLLAPQTNNTSECDRESSFQCLFWSNMLDSLVHFWDRDPELWICHQTEPTLEATAQQQVTNNQVWTYLVHL